VDVVLIDSANFAIENIVPQLGLLSLHNRLKHEFDVEIADFDNMHYTKDFNYDDDVNVTIKKMAEYLAEKNALIYGFYTICNSYPITVLTAKALKEIKPDAKIIFGGPQASLTAKESLKAFDFIDAIGLSEAETYICDFVRELKSGRENFAKIKGICYRGIDGIISTELPKLLKSSELSKMSMVDTLKDCNLKYTNTGTKSFQIEGGRGCPFSCTFCSTKAFWRRNYRIRSVKSLIGEMKELHAQYGYNKFSLEHDFFTMNIDYLHEFCKELIKEDLKYTWGCSSRIDNLSYDSIELMKKAGCIGVFVGLETGSEKMQGSLQKNINIADAIEKIIYIKNMGICVTVSFIYGFPDETVEDFADTMHVVDKLLLNNIRTLQLHKYIPLPKTKELEKVAERLRFNEKDINFSMYRSSINPQSVIDLIKQHPEIFPQFYTFDSEVRSKFRRIDFLMFFLVIVYKEGYLTVRYLLEKYGVLGIYDFLEDKIEAAFQQMDTAALSASFENGYQGPHMKIIKDLYAAFVIRMNEVDNDIYFKNISVFEFQKMLGAFDEDEIYRFDIDILSVLRDQKNVQYKPCWVKYTLLSNGKLRVSMILEAKSELKGFSQ